MPKQKKKSINFKAPATKGDVEELAQITEKNFRRADQRMENMEDRIVKRVVNAIETKWEQREGDLQGAHEDELAAIEGKKDAPSRWKTIPRRLKTVETEVENIKDHLEIS